MEGYFGWVVKSENKMIAGKGSGTRTAKYFKGYFNLCGVKGRPAEIQSRNLLEDGNAFYYILSVGRGKTTWVPYPFIIALGVKNKPLKFVLTKDTGDGKGEVWVAKINAIRGDGENNERITLISDVAEVVVTKQKRNGAGAYYTLSTSQVKTLTGLDTATYQFDINVSEKSDAYIKKIVGEIIGN